MKNWGRDLSRFANGVGPNRMPLIFAVVMIAAVSSAASQAAVITWLHGSPRILNVSTLSMRGQTVSLIGIRSESSNRLCQLGTRRLPCSTLAVSELGRLISNQTVSCEIMLRDKSDQLLGRCSVNGLDIANELIRLGFVESDADFITSETPPYTTAAGGPKEVVGDGQMEANIARLRLVASREPSKRPPAPDLASTATLDDPVIKENSSPRRPSRQSPIM